MIEVKNLVKRYGNFTAVNDISFTLEPGKIYGFLGPNGAGKSTTMNIMTGYIAATSGDVTIFDCDILEEPEEAKRYIGYLPEIPPLYPEMSVEEYLKFAAELKGIKRQEVRGQVDIAIEKTHLIEYRRRLIRNLSKGYRQRVGLAQALLGNPKFVILDEPTVGLDPRQILEIRSLIKDIAQGEEGDEVKPTVILSSHIMQEVSAVCDEIMIIARGRLIASDTPQNLVNQFHKEERIEVIASASEEDVVSVLRPFADQAEIIFDSGDLPEGQVKAILVLEKGNDIRGDLFAAFSKAGVSLVQLYRVVPTLEEIFLTLVHQADEEAEQAELERQRDSRLKVLRRKSRRGALTSEELEEYMSLAPEEAESLLSEEVTDDADNYSETDDAEVELEDVSETVENEEETGGDEE